MIDASALPVMRQDLKLHAVEQDRDGRKRWLLHDPIAHRFFRLGEKAVELLPFINGSTEAKSAETAANQLGREVQAKELGDLARFLRANDLVRGDAEQQARYVSRQAAKPRGMVWLLKHYLFIRRPLANPDKWLSRHVGKVAWLGSVYTIVALGVMLLVGGWLTLRQWDTFIAGFAELGKVAGWFTFGAALIFIKVLHELGHAFAAKAKGARVPTIGIAFIVGWPVLYTDTSDAWRLTQARDRVHIDIAGVAVELAAAVLALLLWHVLPDGLLRNLCFWLATTTWIMSVLVNFNPLMRFDGYHMLADAWRVPNLELRSQALARWKLREWLFRFGETPPEKPRKSLIAFAFGVWIYRLVLFVGIALAVYHFFFKLLGIFLFAVEIWYFILRPIVREIRQWFSLERRPTLNLATLRTLFLLAGFSVLILWPWQNELRLPAFLTQATANIDAPIGGRLHLEVAQGGAIDVGQLLAQVRDPATEHELRIAGLELTQLNWRLRAGGLDEKLLNESPLVRAERDAHYRRVANLETQASTGRIVSPFAGRVQALNPQARQGGWFGEGETIMTLVDSDRVKLTAWVQEEDVQRLAPGRLATFYPLAPAGKPLSAVIESIEPLPVERLEQPEMAARFGGVIPVREDRDGFLLPVKSLYKVQLSIPGEAKDDARLLAIPARRGVIRAEVDSASLIASIWRNVTGVWRRESGF